MLDAAAPAAPAPDPVMVPLAPSGAHGLQGAPLQPEAQQLAAPGVLTDTAARSTPRVRALHPKSNMMRWSFTPTP